MTPNELYLRQPVEILRDDLGPLKGYAGVYDHLPEVNTADMTWVEPILKGSLKGIFEIRFYARRSIDERRVWWLYSLYFEGAPVMILQNAGREGDDHTRRIVSHPDRLSRVVMLLRAHLPVEATDELTDPTSDVKGLDEFYGDSLGSGA